MDTHGESKGFGDIFFCGLWDLTARGRSIVTPYHTKVALGRTRGRGGGRDVRLIDPSSSNFSCGQVDLGEVSASDR